MHQTRDWLNMTASDVECVIVAFLCVVGLISGPAVSRPAPNAPMNTPTAPDIDAPPVPARRNLPPPVPARPDLASSAVRGSTTSLPTSSTDTGTDSPGSRPPVPTRPAPIATPRSSVPTVPNRSSTPRTQSSAGGSTQSTPVVSLANGGQPAAGDTN